MMNKNNYCVIMAGGLGTRFWPMSRMAHPKQFIDILGTGQTLIQQTFHRFLRVCDRKNIYIVTNEMYRDITLKQIPEITEAQVICEPTRRNTAPCIALASYKIAAINPDANIIVAPSDHIIINENSFIDIIKSALKASSKNNWLLTLGIKPNRPDTGYGYIQYNQDFIYADDKRIKKVKTFTEKPTLEMAESFLQSGDFLWNSGIFIWSLKNIMLALEKYIPEINILFKENISIFNTPEEAIVIKQIYTICKSISIDYGVMEKADNVYVIRSDFGWSDLGTWRSLYENCKKNNSGNAVIGKNVLLYDSTDCIVNVSAEKLVVLQGLENYIVVDSGNILLVCKKTDEQQIRTFVNDVLVEKGEQFV